MAAKKKSSIPEVMPEKGMATKAAEKAMDATPMTKKPAAKKSKPTSKKDGKKDSKKTASKRSTASKTPAKTTKRKKPAIIVLPDPITEPLDPAMLGGGMGGAMPMGNPPFRGMGAPGLPGEMPMGQGMPPAIPPGPQGMPLAPEPMPRAPLPRRRLV